MKEIDLENWKRRGHYEFFHRMDYPQYNICMDIDVTHFLAFTKQKKLSFYYAMIFASTTVLNRIENLKYRIRDDKVVVHDTIHPSFTDMRNKIGAQIASTNTVEKRPVEATDKRSQRSFRAAE